MQGEQVHSYLQQLQQKGSKEQPSCGNTKQVVYYKHTLTHQNFLFEVSTATIQLT